MQYKRRRKFRWPRVAAPFFWIFVCFYLLAPTARAQLLQLLRQLATRFPVVR